MSADNSALWPHDATTLVDRARLIALLLEADSPHSKYLAALVAMRFEVSDIERQAKDKHHMIDVTAAWARLEASAAAVREARAKHCLAHAEYREALERSLKALEAAVEAIETSNELDI